MKSTKKQSYFHSKLEVYLNEHFPKMLGNNPFIYCTVERSAGCLL